MAKFVTLEEAFIVVKNVYTVATTGFVQVSNQ